MTVGGMGFNRFLIPFLHLAFTDGTSCGIKKST
jgi:hypothetical protein